VRYLVDKYKAVKGKWSKGVGRSSNLGGSQQRGSTVHAVSGGSVTAARRLFIRRSGPRIDGQIVGCKKRVE
jgi:hypothetical protein